MPTWLIFLIVFFILLIPVPKKYRREPRNRKRYDEQRSQFEKELLKPKNVHLDKEYFWHPGNVYNPND